MVIVGQFLEREIEFRGWREGRKVGVRQDRIEEKRGRKEG